MSAVHHLILYGRKDNASKCVGSDIVYAWARTGQTTPIGLDLHAERATAGLGFEIGGKSGITFVTLQLHYQRPADAAMLHGDRSGVRMSMVTARPRVALRVHTLQLLPEIPPRSIVDLCIRLPILSSGTVFLYLNHAHRLGRHIWSDHFRTSNRTAQPALGLMEAQQPQIVRVLDEPRRVDAGVEREAIQGILRTFLQREPHA